MKIKKINDTFVQYLFQISPEEFEIFISEAFEKIKPKLNIKGFRKGFITRSIFEKKIGIKSLYNDAFEKLMQSKLNSILNNKEFEIIEEPKLINFDFTDLDHKKPFGFGLEFALKPIVKLCDYQNKIKLCSRNQDVKIEDIAVQAKIDELLKKNTSLKTKDVSLFLEKGDIAIFDFKGFIDNKPLKDGEATNYKLEIGSHTFIPGFEEQMIGMLPKETRKITVTFPSDYAKIELANQKVYFDILLHEIQIKSSQTKLNDEFVQKLKLPNIQKVDDLKKQIKEQLEQEKKDKIQNEEIEKILDFLIANSNFKISQYCISLEAKKLRQELEKELKYQNTTLEQYLKFESLTLNELENKINIQSLRNIKIYCISEEIAKKENINILSEEIEQYYSKISQLNHISIDKIKQNKNLFSNIYNYLFQQKITDILLKNVIYEDK